ncbi:MAG: DUF2961 domain-containing protein [Armatimonadetes bacterium]|nr:DUF2961 domain-containing protein [Armatimonadota bacterium]
MTCALLLLPFTCANAAHSSIGEPFGWAAFDPLLLPLLRSATAFQASSSDPTGGNDDKGHFIEMRANVATLLKVKGSGCIYRIWSANPMGELRVYIDDESKPKIKMPFRKLFAQRQLPYTQPLVGKEGGGGYCYVPLPFRRLALIEVINPSSLYYQITYHLAPGLEIAHEFQAQNKLRALERWMSTPGENNLLAKHSEVSVPPREERVLLELHSPATITHLALQVKPTTLRALHSARMRAFWDGETNPSIDVPIADLMCIPFGWARFKSAFVDTDGYWLMLRIPMPFSRSAKLTIVNDGDETVTVTCNAQVGALRMKAGSFGTLHAWFNCEKTKPGIPHMLLRSSGLGQFVGFSLAIVGDSLECYEGDLNIKVDDDTVPSIRGTGTEDEVNGGWYFISGEYATPFAGAPLLLSAKRRASLYRWMLTDCVPFRKRIEASIEHGPNNNCAGCIYRSVALWYQLEPHSILSSPPSLELRLPPPFKEPDVHEAEDAMPKPPKLIKRWIKVIDDSSLPAQLSNGKGIAIAAVSQASLTMPFTVAKEGVYDIMLRFFATTDLVVASSLNGCRASKLELKRGLNKVRLLRCKLNEGESNIKLTLRPQARRDTSTAIAVIDYLQIAQLERAKGATEAEELKAVEGGFEVEWQGSDDIAPYRISPIWEGEWRELIDLSGGGCISFDPSRHGRRLSLEFDAPIDSSYEFALGLLAHPRCGRFKASIDGRAIGGAFSGSATAEYAWHQVGLGASQPLRSGKHRITIESLDGKPLLIDYIVIQPAMAGYQAERMFIISSSRQTKIRKRFGAEPPWRGGAYLKFEAQSPDEHVKLLLPVYKSGIYSMSMTIACMPSGGIFEVSVDGSKVGKAIDSYARAEMQKDVTVGSVKLRRGLHEMMLRVIGKNEASGGYTIGWDELGLELLRASLEVEHKLIALLVCALILAGIFLTTRRLKSR